MSRYLERTTNVARFIEVNALMMMDLPGQDTNLWAPLVQVSGDYSLFTERHGEATEEKVIQFLTFDKDYSNSILSCLTAARESARAVRENISSDLWTEINTYYHLVRDAARTGGNDQPVYDLLREVKRLGMLLGGMAEDTLTRGEGYHFFRMGRLLERADNISRLIDVKYFVLLPSPDFVGTPYDDVQWQAVLRSIGAVEIYRRVFGRISPASIAQLLILDRAFPFSIFCCLNAVNESLRAVSGSNASYWSNPAEKELGQLCADLSFTEVHQLFTPGLHENTDRLQARMNQVDQAIFETFFALHPAPA
jgi:uncharacterized alpha-E superfamily protein